MYNVHTPYFFSIPLMQEDIIRSTYSLHKFTKKMKFFPHGGIPKKPKTGNWWLNKRTIVF